MNKKNVISMFIFSFLAASLLSVIPLQTSIAASKKTTEKVFFGRIIYVANDYIEIKKGKTEFKAYFSDNTKFLSKDGKENEKSIIKVCQYVDVYYTEGTKKILSKIIIKNESDCIK